MRQRGTSLNPTVQSSAAGMPWLQRQCVCSRSEGLSGACDGCRRQRGLDLQKKLAIGTADDPLEHEADRAAEQVLGMAETAAAPGTAVRPRLSRRAEPGVGNAGDAPASVHRVLERPGAPLPAALRGWFEPRFGHDFGKVRVHADTEAAASAREVGAKAYTVGQDVVFGTAAYAPHTSAGRHLLAHELAHVGQQSPQLRRAPESGAKAAAPVDPLCASVDFAAAQSTALALAKAFTEATGLLPLIRALKPIRRCATPAQQQSSRDALRAALPAGKADEAWEAAGTAFGGYTGFYPGFAPDIKRHLGKLGASESLSSGSFEPSGDGGTHKRRATATAGGTRGDLARSDIVYFRGHQYAQYKAPGYFADGDETKGVDLRYFARAGGYGNVKLMISTSCATLCLEAAAVFSSLFPNAVILGYRKSAPLEGDKVRADLTQRINALNRPLLLDQAVDVDTIVATWKSVIESRHKGQTGPQPGICRGGNVEYWDGAAWHAVSASDAANSCKVKGDYHDSYRAP